MNKNKLWHWIKGRDIVLLGKQCLIAIMICGSAAGRHAEPHSEVEESRELTGDLTRGCGELASEPREGR